MSAIAINVLAPLIGGATTGRCVGAARLSFEIGALLNGKTLVEDVTFDMRWRLECNAQTFDRSDQVPRTTIRSSGSPRPMGHS
jgi:hypothetical protein